jgi:hypothetical protein
MKFPKGKRKKQGEENGKKD